MGAREGLAWLSRVRLAQGKEVIGMDLKEIEGKAEETLWTIEALERRLEDLRVETRTVREGLETLLDEIREAKAEEVEL